MKDYKDILSEALNEIKEDELKQIPDEHEIDYEFSDKFKRKSKKLIKEQKRYENRTFSKTLSKIVAVIAATIIAVTMMNKADAFPDKIFEWIYYVYENFIVIIDKQATPYDSSEFVTYTLSEIPDGFSLKKHRANLYSARTEWLSLNGEKTIKFKQYTKNGYYSSNEIISNSRIREFSVNSIDVICINNNTHFNYYWEENNYKFELMYPIEFGEEFASRNIGKLVEKNS